MTHKYISNMVFPALRNLKLWSTCGIIDDNTRNFISKVPKVVLEWGTARCRGRWVGALGACIDVHNSITLIPISMLSDVFQALARENETWNMHMFSVFIPEAISNSWKLRMLLKGTGYFPFDPFLLAHSNIFLYRSQNWDNRAESIWSPMMTSEWIFRRTWDMLWCKTCKSSHSYTAFHILYHDRARLS